MVKSIVETIGNTPLVEISAKLNPTGAHIFAKVESFNPGGSAKDRIALSMIEQAEREGRLKKGATIIEPTSGNTGIGLALVAAVRGYRLILVMPETMSVERQRLATAYGAKVVLTSGEKGMQGALDKAEELKRSIPNAFIPGQFDNPANPLAHELTTGPEIWRDLDGRVDAFVAGVGTGGTFTGVGKYLRRHNPAVKLYAVEPDTSPLISKGIAGAHQLQGIGANFIPSIFDKSLVDELVCVSAKDAGDTARALGSLEGILAGITSGAAMWAALLLAKREEFIDKNVVVLLPDTGERYLSTWLFE